MVNKGLLDYYNLLFNGCFYRRALSYGHKSQMLSCNVIFSLWLSSKLEKQFRQTVYNVKNFKIKAKVMIITLIYGLVCCRHCESGGKPAN